MYFFFILFYFIFQPQNIISADAKVTLFYLIFSKTQYWTSAAKNFILFYLLSFLFYFVLLFYFFVFYFYNSKTF